MARPFTPLSACLTAFTIFCIFFTVPAAAQTNEEGVQRLESIFTELLTQYEEATKSNGATFVKEGKILVEPSDSYYAVTLPHISIKLQDGSYTEIGMIAFNAVPGDTAEQWKMTIAIPTPIIHYDSANTPVVTADIGKQSFAGIWHEEFKNFVKMNAHYTDINIKHHSEQTRIVIPDIKMLYDLAENDQGLWSGPADFMVSDLQIYFDRDGSTASIKEVTMKSVMKDYSIEAALEYQEQINALLESYEGGDTESISGTHIMGLYNMVFDFMSKAWDGFDFSMGMKDFVLTRPPIPGSPPGLMKIGNSHFGFAMNGFRDGAVDLGFKMAYDGFVFEPMDETTSQSVPDHFNIDLSINSLPYGEIVDLGRSSIQSTMDSPQAAQMVGLQAIVMLPQLLTRAQTNLALKDTSIGNEYYNLAAEAMFTANLDAVLGATGSAKTEIYGIDNLINSLTAAVTNPDIDQKKKQSIQQTLGMLSIVKMVGQMSKNAAGQDVRSYNFELNEQGKTMLNGTDLQVLMQSGQPAPAQ